jgi:6-phosphogluconolactonase
VVTEAFGGADGEAAASSYVIADGDELMLVTGTVGSSRSEVCWAVVTGDDRFTFVTNFGDGTISSYEVAADGRLSPVGQVNGMPATVAGLAAS